MKLTDPADKAFDADNSNDATGRDPETGVFLTGNKRSRGRPKGSRARLSEKFFAALHDDFEENGVAAIARMRFHDPSTYVSVIAKLMPQKLEISTPLDGLSDERLAEMLDHFERLTAGTVIEGDVRNITPALPPLAAAPPTEAAQRAEEQRRGLNDQHDALDAVAPVIPASTLPHPVGRAVPLADRDAERRNVAKLDDEINPEDLF